VLKISNKGHPDSSNSAMSEKLKRFNEILIQSIGQSINELVSPNVRRVLYKLLEDRYGIIPDEFPYRLETIYTALDDLFGLRVAGAIERLIAKHFCDELNMSFLNTPECTLQMYIEKAKQLS
jgi:hypothetical protein